MIEAAARLPVRVIRWQVVFSFLASVLLAFAVPHLLLLGPAAVAGTATTLLVSMWAGGAIAAAFTAIRLRRFRFALRALASGVGTLDPIEVAGLGREPSRLTRAWLVPHVLAVGVLVSPWRPESLHATAGISAALLSGVIVAAATLPLQVLVRNAFLRVVELTPPDTMREAAELAERQGHTRKRIARRLLVAVATPVALVAVGAALIAGAHLRRADEYSREETARAIARTSFELGPGLVAGAGLDDAIPRSESLGFTPHLLYTPGEYSITRREDGITVLRTPLDSGAAEMSFSGSTVPPLSARLFMIALLAVVIAGAIGYALGRAYTLELRASTRAVRLLGTEAVLSGDPLRMRAPRFRVVADLERAIQQLADRFRVFAQAQERAIEAREAATRMRGLFFASVSHDLKGPLNAILGFAELVRFEPLSREQAESLDVIERRGRELLALIETILDAARVEAGQLSLLIEPVALSDLLGETIAKAKDLAGEQQVDIVGEFADSIGRITVDRILGARALATLIAYAARHSQGEPVHVRASRIEGAEVQIDINVPNRRITRRHLRRMLSPSGSTRSYEDRGLVLAMGLAKSIIEQHSGRVLVSEEEDGTATLSVVLPPSLDSLPPPGAP